MITEANTTERYVFVSVINVFKYEISSFLTKLVWLISNIFLKTYVNLDSNFQYFIEFRYASKKLPEPIRLSVS